MNDDRLGWIQRPKIRLIDDQAKPDVDELWQAGRAPQNFAFLTRARHLLITLVPSILLAGLVVRLGYLQLRQSDLYRQLVDRNQYRLVSVPAPRGAIVDRNGLPLVDNTPNFTLTVIPASLPAKNPDRDAYLNRLVTLSGLTKPAIEALLPNKTNKKYSASEAVPLVSHIAYDQALKLSVSISDLPGTSVEAYPSRSYRAGEATAGILGYIGAVTDQELAKDPSLHRNDEVGKTGIELKFNDLLMGKPGYVAYERTGKNEFITPAKRQEPVPGATVRLTIDAELQERLYNRLRQQVAAAHSTGGAAVAIDPRNGDVLALVTSPTYDSNWFVNPDTHDLAAAAVTSSQHVMLNRAISGQYPSGSIIKPIIGVAALAEHVITPATTVLSVGGFKVGVNTFPDWKPGGHGITNLAKALAESVNTFFYEVGGGYQQQPGLGVDRIVKYLSMFGWGSKLGIDLPNEAPGLLPTKEWRDNHRSTPWRLGDTYHLAIGQGDVQVTPLQIAYSHAAIANGGTLFQPRLVAEVDGPNGNVIQKTEPVVLRQSLASAANLAAVRDGMRQGVTNGSSRSMQDLPVAVAGKTGTAQFGSEGKTHAWYSVYAPYQDPTIVMAVIVEGGGEGYANALPVAKDILRWYFTRSTPSATGH